MAGPTALISTCFLVLSPNYIKVSHGVSHTANAVDLPTEGAETLLMGTARESIPNPVGSQVSQSKLMATTKIDRRRYADRFDEAMRIFNASLFY